MQKIKNKKIWLIPKKIWPFPHKSYNKNSNKKINYYGTCKSWTLRWVPSIHWLSLVLLWQKGWRSYLCLRQKRTKNRFIYRWSLYAMDIQGNLGEVFSLNQMTCVFTGLFSKEKEVWLLSDSFFCKIWKFCKEVTCFVCRSKHCCIISFAWTIESWNEKNIYPRIERLDRYIVAT